ncbi:hypothetical protein GFH48_38840 [Streptomyces fagopyri]|uniref:Uncharacterized protein n=1 Tax=Streptomyces fagopyri TaxID=2662397 RepID=A0A5Q0LN36_9ACTN|nr:hypothetical protein GFH48_38840 [Streptomyces fagopyri]
MPLLNFHRSSGAEEPSCTDLDSPPEPSLKLLMMLTVPIDPRTSSRATATAAMARTMYEPCVLWMVSGPMLMVPLTLLSWTVKVLTCASPPALTVGSTATSS